MGWILVGIVGAAALTGLLVWRHRQSVWRHAQLMAIAQCGELVERLNGIDSAQWLSPFREHLDDWARVRPLLLADAGVVRWLRLGMPMTTDSDANARQIVNHARKRVTPALERLRWSEVLLNEELRVSVMIALDVMDERPPRVKRSSETRGPAESLSTEPIHQ